MNKKFRWINVIALCSVLSITNITTVFAEGEEVIPAKIEETAAPTTPPTPEPTVVPTAEPTAEPTVEPTIEPTVEPTAEPTIEPTPEPTAEPEGGIAEQSIGEEEYGIDNQAIGGDTQNGRASTVTGYYVVDGNGNTIQSYFYNGQYDLFLTEACSLNNLTIYSTKPIVATTRGTIAENQMSLVADFSSGNNVTLTLSDNEKSNVVVMQSSLPSLFIDLDDANGVTLQTVHANKDVKYAGNKVVLTDSSNSSNNLKAENVTIGGRGNTSWTYYEKKGYQIKFEKKTNVLGMGKAKKWVLLANAADGSMMMNKLAYDLSHSLGMDYATSGEYVDLWIEGDYRGTYLVSEKVEIGDNRIELDENGVVAELDNSFYRSEVYQQDLFGNHFVLKDPDVEEVGDNFDEFIDAMDQAEELIPTSDWSKFTKLVDVDSVAKMYLINEYMANNEYTTTSNYWYYDGTIHAGPVWDFDTSTYLQSNPSKLYVFNLSIFSQLIARPEFMNTVKNIYSKYNQSFKNLSSNINELKNRLASSAAMNYTRWDNLGKDVPKGGKLEPTYAGNVDKLNNWITSRYKLFKLPEVDNSITLDVSDNRETMTLQFLSDTPVYGNVKFAVWNEENGQNDLAYYQATRISNTKFQAKVKLSNHEIAGSIVIDVLVNNNDVFIKNYVIRDITSGSDWVSMYRMYNPNSGEHFYTNFDLERNILVEAGWTYEGIGWRAPRSSSVPVYRLYNSNAGDHHYTTGAYERDFLIDVGWRYEGIGWYSDENETVPLYRQYNPYAKSGTHNYTVNGYERDYLVNLGWRDEGIGWYGK